MSDPKMEALLASDESFSDEGREVVERIEGEAISRGGLAVDVEIVGGFEGSGNRKSGLLGISLRG